MNDIIVIVKYSFVMVFALLMEWVVTVIYNAIGPAFNMPYLNSFILVITIPITVLIFAYFMFRDTIYPQGEDELD